MEDAYIAGYSCGASLSRERVPPSTGEAYRVDRVAAGDSALLAAEPRKHLGGTSVRQLV